MPTGHIRGLRRFVLAYGLFIVLASLWPLHGWRAGSEWSAAFLTAPWPRYVTRNDLLTNLLVYLPLGYALALMAAPRHRGRGAIWATLAGLALSASLESLQLLMPGRIASNLDLLLNGLGALAGGLQALHHGRWLRAWRSLRNWRSAWFNAGGWTNLGLVLLVLWFMAQFSLLPISGIGWLQLHLRPFDRPPTSLAGLNLDWFVAMFVEMLAIGAFCACLLRPGRYVAALALLFVAGFVMKLLAATMLLRLSAAGGVLSLESLAAFLLALWLLLLPSLSRRRWALALLGLAAMVGLRLVMAWHFFPDRSLLNVTGLAQYLAVLWPPLALLWMLTVRTAARPLPESGNRSARAGD